MPESYKDLIAWQKAMVFARDAYRATANFPREEVFGLTSQIRRAAVSVPSNIAEGKGRYSPRDFQHFLKQARGSLNEIETQLLLAQDLGYFAKESGCNSSAPVRRAWQNSQWFDFEFAQSRSSCRITAPT